MFINGEITTVEIIPTGANVFINFMETGAVKNCAPMLALTDSVSFSGVFIIRRNLKNSDIRRIPAKAE